MALAASIAALSLACGTATRAPTLLGAGPESQADRATRERNERGALWVLHDEFRGERRLRLDYDLYAGMDVTLVGVVPRDPVWLVFHVDRRRGPQRYLDCQGVEALRDGQPFPLPPFRHDLLADLSLGGEQVYGTLPRETLDQLATARSLRFRVCGHVVTFTPGQLADLREYARRWRAVQAGDAAALAGLPVRSPDGAPRGGSCSLPVAAVVVCRSALGYLFAIPAPGACAPGSVALRTLGLTCADLSRPAYHACLVGTSGWRALRSWESCASQGLQDAPGDFLPPGRTPAQGVTPDPPAGALRCYSPTGVPVLAEASSCRAAGLGDTPGTAPRANTPPAPWSLPTPDDAGVSP